MAATALVEARVDESLKIAAEKIFAEDGLTLSDVLRLLMIRTVEAQTVPHDLFRPNPETIAAMEAGRRGEVFHADTVEQLIADLHADD
jgi:DNA-damage-inducible protein J